jgi:hypothetical protein
MTDQLIPIPDRRVPHAAPYTPERRDTDTTAVIALITEIHRDVKDLDKKLTKHMLEETSELAQEIAALMIKAFPEGDPSGHKAAHEAWIKKTESQAAFWEKMKFELVRWGLIAIIGWAVVALWKQFVLGVPK